MTLYSIRNWNKLFENNRSRAIEDLRWVAIPNRHDGETFTAIMSHADGAVIFTGWILMVQLASKCKPRGTLLKGNGEPHNVTSMSVKCRCNVSWLTLAINYLVAQTDWLEAKEFIAERQVGDVHPAPERQVGVIEGREGMERREEGRPVELPAHFPQTVDDAVAQCQTMNIPPLFVIGLWNEAAGLGGKAAYGGQVIENWAFYVNGQYLRKQHGQHERAASRPKKSGGFVP